MDGVHKEASDHVGPLRTPKDPDRPQTTSDHDSGAPRFHYENYYNFVLGRRYEQEKLPADEKHQPLAVVCAYAERRAAEHDAVGYFYQQHSNGHEILGFYADTVCAGPCIQHGHRRGFVAGPLPASSRFDIDVAANFIAGAPYDHENFPEHAKKMMLATALNFCEMRAIERGAVSAEQRSTPVARGSRGGSI